MSDHVSEGQGYAVWTESVVWVDLDVSDLMNVDAFELPTETVEVPLMTWSLDEPDVIWTDLPHDLKIVARGRNVETTVRCNSHAYIGCAKEGHCAFTHVGSA